MNKYQITLVQESFSKIIPISSLAAELFYNKLFELNPKLKPLFKQDITEQGTKLMKMLGVAVNNLNNLEMLIPIVQTLGERHIGYGVKEEHYDTVGEALIWTLEQGLGKDFTPELKDAWLITYTTLATVMIEAANKKLA
ncbi:MAG: globin family protein [Paraglaciecola sp.]|uniref:globin family protein n=1 Tax=Paraglaciecola sp. TaxID=1920173 RepID=UPI0032986A37